MYFPFIYVYKKNKWLKKITIPLKDTVPHSSKTIQYEQFHHRSKPLFQQKPDDYTVSTFLFNNSELAVKQSWIMLLQVERINL